MDMRPAAPPSDEPPQPAGSAGPPVPSPDERGPAGAGLAEGTLTPRQVEVLKLLADGLSMKEAGRVLNIAPRTVAFHKYQMMAQLKITSSAGLIRYAVRRGVV
jgi:DNA-binding CsgD family transcriptional regulator